MLFLTLTSPMEHGDRRTPPNVYGFGTNQWPLLTYPDSLQLILTSQRPSPFMGPTASLYCHTQPYPTPKLMPGWLYPIPTRQQEYSPEDRHFYNVSMGSSLPNPTPRILTPTLPTSLHIGNSDNEDVDSTHSDMTITGDPEDQGTLSIPTEPTLSGQNSTPWIERSSDQSEPLPGNSGGRTSGTHPTFQIPLCFPILLCQEEGQHLAPSPGLLQAK